MLAKTELGEAGRQLLAVAEYIEEHGWCQNMYKCNDTACILGAAMEVLSSGDPDDTPGMLKLQKHLGNVYIDQWNDEEGRTKEQVIDKLREVAYL